MLDLDEEKVFLAETIPSGLKFTTNTFLPNIGKSLISLIKTATSSIEVASIYTTFLNTDTPPIGSDSIGKRIYQELLAAAERGVTIRFVVTMVSKNFPQTEVIEMSKNYPKQIFVGFLDMAKLTSSQSGLQHTKTFIIDKKSFYLGSANCDWRAYSEVVEIGIFGLNIKNATEDILKIFEMYWYVSYLKQPLPQRWPRKFSPYFGKYNPMIIGKEEVPVYFSASPSMFVSKGRLNDINAIVDLINNTNSGIIRMCAMEISNVSIFEKKTYFWGNIDFALRKASMERQIPIHIMAEKKEVRYLKMRKSLQSLHMYNTIRVKLISIPDREIPIPHARLFHTKLCIGAGKAWLGTNNFTPDYFHKVAGIGCTISGTTPGGVSMIETLTNVFDRYYNSSYASFLEI